MPQRAISSKKKVSKPGEMYNKFQKSKKKRGFVANVKAGAKIVGNGIKKGANFLKKDVQMIGKIGKGIVKGVGPSGSKEILKSHRAMYPKSATEMLKMKKKKGKMKKKLSKKKKK